VVAGFDVAARLQRVGDERLQQIGPGTRIERLALLPERGEVTAVVARCDRIDRRSLGATASIGGRSARTRRNSASAYGVDDSVSDATRAGARAASSSAITPPVWWPTTWARAIASASSTSSAASAQAAMPASRGTGSEAPKPAVSTAIARRRAPISGSTCAYSRQLRGVWCSSTTDGVVASPQAA
jgi:hypothetical protein